MSLDRQIENGELQLVNPRPRRLALGRQIVAPPEIKKNVCSLPEDQLSSL